MWMLTVFQPTIYNIDITLLSELGDGYVCKERGYKFFLNGFIGVYNCKVVKLLLKCSTSLHFKKEMQI